MTSVEQDHRHKKERLLAANFLRKLREIMTVRPLFRDGHFTDYEINTADFDATISLLTHSKGDLGATRRIAELDLFDGITN